MDHARRGESSFVLDGLEAEPSVAQRADSRGNCLLHYACLGLGGDADLVRRLIHFGASVNARNLEGKDALMFACRSGHVAVVSLLLSKGADPNSRSIDISALEQAASYGNFECCQILLKAKANLNEIVTDGQTALDFYSRFKYLAPNLSYHASLKRQHSIALRTAFEQGPHPDMCWKRRWPFVCVLVGCDFHPLLARKLALLELNPPLPPDAEIPPIVIATPEQYRAYLQGCVFPHPGLWKLIASYL